VLAFAPFLFSGAQPLNVAAKVCVFILLVASYDLLLGYTGIVSFAHTMFFGIGGYGVAIALARVGPTWEALAVGIAAAIVVASVLALVIGLLSLRVRAIFFAMITLAVATAFAVLASQLSGFTGGEDGLNYRVPDVLRPSFRLFEAPLLGTAITGRVITYYIVFLGALIGFIALLRVVNSPFGRVLQAIRENDFRAEALGYRVVVYRSVASVVSAMMAALHGARHDAIVRNHDRRAPHGRDRRHGHDVWRRDRRVAHDRRRELSAGRARTPGRGGIGYPSVVIAIVGGTLAAVARHPVRAERLFFPDRNCREAAPAGDEALTISRVRRYTLSEQGGVNGRKNEG
jgi:ABC-type branched-subunit amino acid transport system permease subunit